MNLADIWQQINHDPALKASYDTDPKATLARLGVDTSQIVFRDELSVDELNTISAGGTGPIEIGVGLSQGNTPFCARS